ncbi:MAG: hypothetical protein QNJ48_15610 [Desulfobacterales bacterium]|nr:hypothetical protein [Desulfobacterales bacterium]
MGQPESRFLECILKRYPGRIAIGVGYSQGMEEVFPIVIDDDRGDVLGIVAMAAMEHDNIASVHIYHFSVFNQRRGNGTKMLKILCRKADRLHVVLSLTPIPSPNGEDDSISSEKLTTWYQQFGFEGDTFLRRQPRTTNAGIRPVPSL